MRLPSLAAMPVALLVLGAVVAYVILAGLTYRVLMTLAIMGDDVVGCGVGGILWPVIWAVGLLYLATRPFWLLARWAAVGKQKPPGLPAPPKGALDKLDKELKEETP